MISDVGEDGTLIPPLMRIVCSYQRRIVRDNEFIEEYINVIYSRNTKIELGWIKGEPTDLKVISDIYDKMYQRREEKGRI